VDLHRRGYLDSLRPGLCGILRAEEENVYFVGWRGDPGALSRVPRCGSFAKNSNDVKHVRLVSIMNSN
jgi:hypothetical protein